MVVVRLMLIMFLVLPLCVVAGPLIPPAAPSSTPGPEPRIPLNQLNTPGDANSVYRITQPGSYYLERNLNGVAGRHGIEIAASNVTLDLNGFAVRGVPGSLNGITVDGATGGVVVENGSVGGWGDNGVAVVFVALVTGSRIENIHAYSNGSVGIWASNVGIVRSCTAVENGSIGISSNGPALIESCIVIGSNTGIRAQGAATVSGCLVTGTATTGIFATEGVIISNCSTIYCGGNGIQANSSCRIVDCVASNNSFSGFSINAATTIEGCQAYNNMFNGIFATQPGCSILRNTVSNNARHGILVEASSLVKGNLSENNGVGLEDGAGIHVEGEDNRIEDNNCVENDWGIQVTAPGNFIVANTCSGNRTLNWDVVADNVCLVVEATLSGAVSGNSGGVAPGSGSPWANFTY